MKSEMMKLAAAFLSLVIFCLMIGCGGDDGGMVPVSGTVTMDGKPLAGVQINFFPQPTNETAIVGPFSNAITDTQGKFTLKSRYGDPGAVVGMHKVSVKYEGVDMEDVAAQEIEIKEMMEDAKDMGEKVDSAELAEEKELLKKLRAAASSGGVSIPSKYAFDSELRFDVPGTGTDAANFDLSSK